MLGIKVLRIDGPVDAKDRPGTRANGPPDPRQLAVVLQAVPASSLAGRLDAEGHYYTNFHHACRALHWAQMEKQWQETTPEHAYDAYEASESYESSLLLLHLLPPLL